MLDVLVSITDEEATHVFGRRDHRDVHLLMFAGTTPAPGPRRGRLIELMRQEVHRVRGTRRPLRRRPGGEFPSRCARFRCWTTWSRRPFACIPPLIILMRVAQDEFDVRDLFDPQRRFRGPHRRPSPTGSPRISPIRSALTRVVMKPPREGRHPPVDLDTVRGRPASLRRCGVRHHADQGDLLGVAARYEFEMSQPSETYRNDHSKMVVQLARPAEVRYRKNGWENRHGQLPHRGRPRPVPGPRHVRVGTRLLPGSQAGHRRDPRRRTARDRRTEIERAVESAPPVHCHSGVDQA